MERKEEIQQKAGEEAWYIADTSQTKEEAAIKGYCLGAAYADRTMLDRACEWLGNRHNIEKCLGILTSRTEDLSKAFRQAMEGGADDVR